MSHLPHTKGKFTALYSNFVFAFCQIRSHFLRSVAIFSDDDLWVPLDNQDDFRDTFGSEIVVEHKKHHLGGGFKELPIVLEKVLELSS